MSAIKQNTKNSLMLVEHASTKVSWRCAICFLPSKYTTRHGLLGLGFFKLT